MTPLIAANSIGLSRTSGRRQRVLFDGLSLAVEPGKVTVVSGPSMSGKTTLVGVLAGWQAVTAGSVEWANGNPTWATVAVVPQGFALLDELTVQENILLAARSGSVDVDPSQCAAIVDRLQLTTLLHRSADEISVGERQRTMVARGLVGRPPCVLADEPVADQDDANVQAILDLLCDVAARGGGCLIATRNVEALRSRADVVIELGRDDHEPVPPTTP